MKKLLFIFLFFTLFTFGAKAQGKFYSSTGGEMIFSLATIDYNGQAGDNILRWTPWFNFQYFANYDFNKYVGLFSGAAIRNVGFIYNDAPNITSIGNDEYDNDVIKYKFRNYDFGIPFGIKIGKMDGIFLYGGYEIEFPFWFKQKMFVNDVKQDAIINDWFSPRTPAFYNTFFAGVQFPYGLSLKFKYYTSQFLNENYTETQNGIEVKPYEGLKANVWYFSLCFDIFDKGQMVYEEKY